MMAAYGSDMSLLTPIKIYFRNKYFYKSITFNISMSDQNLELYLNAIEIHSFSARFKSLYRSQTIGLDFILKLHSHTLAYTQTNRNAG